MVKDMSDFRFDEIIKEKLADYQIEVGDEVWSGIEKKMQLARRRKIVFRASAISIAMAACLAVALLLNIDRQTDILKVSALAIEDYVSESTENTKVEKQVSSNEDVVLPITQQIESFVENSSLAINSPKENNAEDVSNVKPIEIKEEKVEIKEKQIQQQREVVDVEVVNVFKKDERPDIRDESFVPQNEVVKEEKRSSLDFYASSSSAISGFSNYKTPTKYAASLSSQNSTITIEQISKNIYSLPVSFGIKGNFDINEKFSVGLGLNYSYLETTFDAYVNKVGFLKTSNQLHYVGISVDGYYKFYQLKQFNFYGKAGATLDKGILQRYVYGSQEIRRGINGLQVSVNLGLGAEWKALQFFGLYFEPTLHYYFDTKQPMSIHTNQPINFGISAGARFYLKPIE